MNNEQAAREFMKQVSKLMAASRMIGFQDAVGTKGQREQARADEKKELNKLLDILSPPQEYSKEAETWH